MLKLIKDNSIYPLLQPRFLNQNRSNQSITKIYKIVKSIIKEKWYQKLEHINNNNLTQISKLAIRILFFKYNTNTKPEFYEACTLGK